MSKYARSLYSFHIILLHLIAFHFKKVYIFSYHSVSHASTRADELTEGYMFCKFCGSQIEESFSFCPKCGKRQKETATVTADNDNDNNDNNDAERSYGCEAKKKSLVVAGMLNLIFPGIGYFYVGKKCCGVVFVETSVVAAAYAISLKDNFASESALLLSVFQGLYVLSIIGSVYHAYKFNKELAEDAVSEDPSVQDPKNPLL